MPSYKQHQEKRSLVENLIAQGLTKQQISEQSGIPFGSMNHYLKMWGLKTARRRGKGVKYLAKTSKYDYLRADIEVDLRDGKTQFEIADKYGIPRGTIPYTLQSWGIQKLGKESRGGHLTKSGKMANFAKLKESHKRRTGHPIRGMKFLRGNYVPEQEFLTAVKECLSRHLTYDQMCAELGIKSNATIWSILKKYGILPGARKGENDPKWKGGHGKYRGPDWYTNRKLALQRDNHTCQRCGMSNEQSKKEQRRGLSVHHIIPYEISQDSSLPNLITYCQVCHMIVEWDSGRLKIIV